MKKSKEMLFIAEVGQNHQGDKKILEEMENSFALREVTPVLLLVLLFTAKAF